MLVCTEFEHYGASRKIIRSTMAIFEFYCPDNNRIYSFFARNAEQAKCIPRCPDNPAFHMERRISSFSVTGIHSKSSEGGIPDDDDPRMIAAMGEMEHMMAGMDQDQPDPRKMGQIMRRMAELSGEKLDGNMEAMIRKLEEGCSPDQLEEELGSVFDNCGEENDIPGDTTEPGGSLSVRWEANRRKLMGPQRDPKLYDYD